MNSGKVEKKGEKDAGESHGIICSSLGKQKEETRVIPLSGPARQSYS